MTDPYKRAGVDVSGADRGIKKIVTNIQSTWPKSGIGRVMVENGYFANVIDIGGNGLAVTTDGVGSKTMIAEYMNDFTTIGIDCVAMNVNDLICVGAKPISMLDYIGVEDVDERMLEEIGVGLMIGAKQAGISISGGEVSQLPDTMQGFDLVGSAFGLVPLDKILLGDLVEPGDAIVGLASSGIHSNGLTLARRVLIDDEELDLDHNFGMQRSLGKELLFPTAIYVKEVLDLLECLPVKALVNITGDGLLNLNRIQANVGFLIDSLPDCPEIFDLIQYHGDLDDTTMFQTFNMGIGFCIIVAPEYAQDVITIMARHLREAFWLGWVVTDEDKSVQIPSRNLIGRGKTFVRQDVKYHS